jgi:hypothetical protein
MHAQQSSVTLKSDVAEFIIVHGAWNNRMEK